MIVKEIQQKNSDLVAVALSDDQLDELNQKLMKGYSVVVSQQALIYIKLVLHR
ncbi:hypothetical protein [Vagococcus salmoninarum]|uniref:hypothetical protein n=1 Tax=Vagococcus salmoninarum TaxID=2739 RepID=UPI003F964E50